MATAKHLLQEKPHIVNRLVNLTPEQKNEINEFFTTHRNLENQIDWNKGQKLTYQDFKTIINANAGTFKNKLKRVKQLGLEGMKEGEDYDRIDTGNPEMVGIVPYSHEVTRMLASDAILGLEGQWCIAYQKDTKFWDDYTSRGDTFLIILSYRDEEKYAIQMGNHGINVWDASDRSNSSQWFCTQYNIEPAVFKDWCKQAKKFGENIERKPNTFLEIEPYWYVSHEQDHVEINLSIVQMETDDDGGESYETNEEAYTAKVSMYLIGLNNPPPKELEAKLLEQDFVYSRGIGLYIELPENTHLFDEAERLASIRLNGEWRDTYQDDAIAEVYQYIFGEERRGGVEKKKFFPADYIIVNDEEIMSDRLLSDFLSDSIQLSLRVNKDYPTELGDDFVYLIGKDREEFSRHSKEDWEGLDQNTPKAWDSPEQQHFNFDEQRNKNIMKILLG